MPNRILTIEGYQDAIRELLGVTVLMLPDTAIDRENIITIAESAVIKQVPNYAEIIADIENSDDAVYLRSAVISQVAARCCPGLEAKFKTSEQSETGYNYKKENVDWTKKKVEFEAQATEYIGMISSIELQSVDYSPNLAGLTGPTRSASNS